MKTYEEMTVSVLQKTEYQRAAHRRRCKIGLSAATCVLCVCAVILAIVRVGDTPTGSAGTTGRLVLLAAAADNGSHHELIQDVVTPSNFWIRVRDISTNNSALWVEILEEEYAWDDAFRSNSGLDCAMTRFMSDTTLITVIYETTFYVAMKDYEQVESMSVSTTDAGSATAYRVRYKNQTTDALGSKTTNYDADSLSDASTQVSEGVAINWMLSDATVAMIDKDPKMDLSKIKDTITVTVVFKDGSTESAVIDLSVSAEGQVYVTHRESIAAA